MLEGGHNQQTITATFTGASFQCVLSFDTAEGGVRTGTMSLRVLVRTDSLVSLTLTRKSEAVREIFRLGFASIEQQNGVLTSFWPRGHVRAAPAASTVTSAVRQLRRFARD